MIFIYFLSWDQIYTLSEKGTKIILTKGKTKKSHLLKPIIITQMNTIIKVVLKNPQLQSHPSEGVHSSEMHECLIYIYS